jgi:hypothetical protein
MMLARRTTPVRSSRDTTGNLLRVAVLPPLIEWNMELEG